MTEKTFDELMMQHDMGQAYVRITAAMGPSPQLLAFVNYDNITDDSLGLESLDIMSQHEQILSEIDSDVTLSMATESLASRVKSGAEKIKNVLTGNKHGSDLSAFTKGKLESRSSNISVEPRAEFERLVGIHAKMLPLLEWLVRHIPRSHNVDEWNKFAKTAVQLGSRTEFAKKAQEVEALRAVVNNWKVFSTVEFEKSGWNEANFKAGVATYLSNIKKSASSYQLSETICDDLTDLIDDLNSVGTTVSTSQESSSEDGKEGKTTKTVTKGKDAETATALKAMNAAFSGIWDAFMLCYFCENNMKDALKSASHHFKVAA